MNAVIENLRKEGYPYKIKGNGGYTAVFGIQPLLDGEHEAIYRHPGGECVHHISEIKAFFETIEQ